MKSLFYQVRGKIPVERVSIIKLKINGVCVNKCRFCLFHSDPQRLEVKDIAYFFDMIETPSFNSIVINGGEPTIHPNFLKICSFLSKHFKGRTVLSLGTNLIPLSKNSGKYPEIYKTVLKTFDNIVVGCDDEHRNIHILERLAPEIVEAGVTLFVNVVAPYCSSQTRRRILTLTDRLGAKVYFSEVHHLYKSRPVVNNTSIPCRFRVKTFQLNCNGDGYFCTHQEMEDPVFNLSTVTREELNFFLNEYNPGFYRFCPCCPLYQSESRLQGLFSKLT